MSTKKTDDMTDRGNYDLSPWGAFDRYSDCCYRVTFRGVEANFDLGVYDSKAEAEKVIADHIAGARECAKEDELRRQREAEERVEAARIPPAYQGHSLEGADVALTYVENFARNRHADVLMFGVPDGNGVRVAYSAERFFGQEKHYLKSEKDWVISDNSKPAEPKREPVNPCDIVRRQGQR